MTEVRSPTIVEVGSEHQLMFEFQNTEVKEPEPYISNFNMLYFVPYQGTQLSFLLEEKEKNYESNDCIRQAYH